MKSKLKSLFVGLFTVVLFTLVGCTATDPNNPQYAMDPNVKIAIIVICSLVCAGTLGYGIYFYIKNRKKDK